MQYSIQLSTAVYSSTDHAVHRS